MRSPCACLLTLLTLAACARPEAPAAPPRAEHAPREQEPEELPFRVLSPREIVPPFRVRALDGTLLDSSALIGKQAFVVVFFATWCDVCDLKLPVLHAAVAESATPTPLIGVAVDDRQSWPEVASFLRRHQIAYPTVRADDYPRFALAYGPMQTVPAVAIVGKHGYLVDYQVGYGQSHAARVRRTLALAHGQSADTPPTMDD